MRLKGFFSKAIPNAEWVYIIIQEMQATDIAI